MSDQFLQTLFSKVASIDATLSGTYLDILTPDDTQEGELPIQIVHEGINDRQVYKQFPNVTSLVWYLDKVIQACENRISHIRTKDPVFTRITQTTEDPAEYTTIGGTTDGP
jgi:hypothetical protein